MKPYYEEAGITIYHGDCRDVLPRLGEFDSLITDPPFGISFASQPTTGQRRAGMKAENWDDLPADFVAQFITLVPRAAVWGGNYFSLPLSRGWLSWYKPDAPPSMGQFELCWTNVDQNTRQISCSIAQTNPERLGHPTQKPMAVMKWTLAKVCPEAKRVVDPFAGSGTTLSAAKEFGMEAVGIELDERYCEIAANRLRQSVLNFGGEA